MISHKDAGLIKGSEFAMETYTGKHIDIWAMKEEDIDLVDIAHHLSLICRFGGACKEFYSVGQHSLLVRELVVNASADKMTQLTALLHDAAEAYIGDLIRPLKYTQPKLIELEKRIMGTISKKFGISGGDYELVNKMDDVALAIEARQLVLGWQSWNLPDITNINIEISEDFPQVVENKFIGTYKALRS